MPVIPQQLREMESRLAAGRRGRAPVETRRQTTGPLAAEAIWPVLPVRDFEEKTFTYSGAPVPKPRMTRRDKWKQRPCVLRYRAFADSLREAAGTLPPDPDAILIEARVPMPASWPDSKKTKLTGKPCRQTLDIDNIEKGVFDALFKRDACIWLGLTLKYWCPSGDEGLKVTILYAKPV